MLTNSYNDDLIQGLLSAPVRYLKTQSNLLFDRSWSWRYYNEMSWVFGIYSQELLDFKQLYDGTLQEIRERPELDGLPLSNEKIKSILNQFPNFDPIEFIYEYEVGLMRAFLAYFIFPYGIYLMIKCVKKTNKARKIFSEITILSDKLVNIFETDNIEGWLILNKQTLQKSNSR